MGKLYTIDEIREKVKPVAERYGIEKVLLFGSYARGEADEDSDIDVIVVGGDGFHGSDVFAFGEDLRELTQKDVDAFEIREVNPDSELYNNVMREGLIIIDSYSGYNQKSAVRRGILAC